MSIDEKVNQVKFSDWVKYLFSYYQRREKAWEDFAIKLEKMSDKELRQQGRYELDEMYGADGVFYKSNIFAIFMLLLCLFSGLIIFPKSYQNFTFIWQQVFKYGFAFAIAVLIFSIGFAIVCYYRYHKQKMITDQYNTELRNRIKQEEKEEAGRF